MTVSRFITIRLNALNRPPVLLRIYNEDVWSHVAVAAVALLTARSSCRCISDVWAAAVVVPGGSLRGFSGRGRGSTCEWNGEFSTATASQSPYVNSPLQLVAENLSEKHLRPASTCRSHSDPETANGEKQLAASIHARLS